MNDDREHKVRERAYALWETEGRPNGRHDEHWRRASSEIFEATSGDAPDAKPQDASAPGANAKPARRKPVAASPSAADTPSAVEESAPAPRKRRTVKPKAI